MTKPVDQNKNAHTSSPGDLQTVDRGNALRHYIWGEQCDGWELVNEPAFSVKLERIPPGAGEKKHHHRYARQFFFVLKGSAVVGTGAHHFTIHEQQGIHIAPGQIHSIVNQADSDLEFILFSHPSTVNDRIDENDR